MQANRKNSSQLDSNTSSKSTLGFQDVLAMSQSTLAESEDANEKNMYRALQYCKLVLAVATISAVLIALSAISIVRSLDGIYASVQLEEYVKFGDLINAIQGERAISCIYLGTTK